MPQNHEYFFLYHHEVAMEKGNRREYIARHESAQDASSHGTNRAEGFERDHMLSLDSEDRLKLENDYDDGVIYKIVIACLALFSGRTHKENSPSAFDNPEAVSQRPEEVAGFIEDMHRSFNIWINYTGALAADVSRSLDARLQESKDIKNMAIELLQMLTRNLEYSMLLPYILLS